MKKKKTISKERPFRDMLDIHAERAVSFKLRNRNQLKLFNHMLGYGVITRGILVALHHSAEAGVDYKDESERQKQIHRAKVLIALDTRFYDSLYSAVRLLAFGMTTEAKCMVRVAFEALQYHRLLHYREEISNEFETKPTRPVEVRKQLEEIGHDADAIRKVYSEISASSHIGGPGSLDFTFDPDSLEVVSMGGREDPETQDQLMEQIVEMMHHFGAFALGIDESNASKYFDDLRSTIGDKPFDAQAAEAAYKLVDKYRFVRT